MYYIFFIRRKTVYCHTYLSRFSCVFNELQLWSHISSEHPIFLTNVASLTKVNLPKTVVDKLDEAHKRFLAVYNNAVYLKKVIDGNPYLYYRKTVAIKKAINDFIINDTMVLSFYPQLLEYGTHNQAWQELVKHIISEQNFMLELFKDLRQQIR